MPNRSAILKHLMSLVLFVATVAGISHFSFQTPPAFAGEQKGPNTITPVPLTAADDLSADQMPRISALIPLPQTITATKQDALSNDVAGNSAVNPGDTLRYTITITNTGGLTATGLVFSDVLESNLTLSGTVIATPLAFDDVYTTVGNVLLEVGTFTPSAVAVTSTRRITANDVAFNGTNAYLNDSSLYSVTQMDTASPNGGTITNTGSGGFQYLPPAGFTGTDSFGYVIQNTGNGLTDTGVVSVTVSNMVWFVKNNAAAGGNGNSVAPFDALADVSSEPLTDTGHIIFVYEGDGGTTNYNTEVTLLNNQQLIGEGAGLTVDGRNLVPAGNRPQLGESSGDGVTVAQNNTIRGLNIGNTPSGVGIVGNSVGTLTINDVSVAGSGGLLDIDTGTLAATLGGLTSSSAPGAALNLSNVSGSFSATTVTIDNSTGAGIALNNNSGTVNVNGGTIGASNDPAGNAVDVNGGAGNVTIAASVTKTTSGKVVEVTGRSGGAVTLSGNLACNSGCTGVNVANNGGGGTVTFSGSTKTINTSVSDAVAVNLDNNDGAGGGHTINFTNGGLAITSNSNAGFNAINGAIAINVTGTGNTIGSTTGIALNIDNSTIGASGLMFQNISSTGSTANPAISLVSTGNNGGLNVTGDGSNTRNNSGGTIQNKTGDAVVLNNASRVSLAHMNIIGNNSNDNGIEGTNVNGFVLNHSTVTGHGNDSTNTSNLFFRELTGTGINGANPTIISNTLIAAADEHNVIVKNETGILQELYVFGSTIGSTTFGGRNSDDGINFEALSGGAANAIMNLTVLNSAFVGNGGDHINPFHNGNQGAMNVTISDNTFDSSQTNPDGVGGGMTLAQNDAAATSAGTTYNYTVTNNIMNSVILVAIDTNQGISTAADVMSGLIANNTIGTLGVAGSGSSTGSGIRARGNSLGSHNVTIQGNTIRNWANGGAITVQQRDGNGTLNAHVYSNTTVIDAGSVFGSSLDVRSGATGGDAGTVCVDIGGAGALSNTFVDPNGFDPSIWVEQRFSTTMRFPTYTGAATNPAANANLNTFLDGRNSLGPNLVGAGDAPTFVGEINTGISGGNPATCF